MSGSTGRVAQAGSEVVHDALPAAIGRARVAQAGVETVHNAVPSHSGRCRMAQLGIEIVRAVSEVAASGTSRVQVVVICG